MFSEQVDEVEVDALWLEADVDEHEQEEHLLAFEDVVGDDFREGSTLALRGAGIAIAGQIDQIPTVVDAKVVYQACLSGGCRYFGQPFVAGEHVDER